MHDQMQPQNQQLPNGEVDHEGAMAKADLYKLANYSLKLFKQMDDNAQIEAWVQAKITKAADYIASVYHFMEYDMKISDYGSKLENAEMYSESIRRAFAQKLTEAKTKQNSIPKVVDLDVAEGFQVKDSKGKVVHVYNTDSEAKKKSAELSTPDNKHKVVFKRTATEKPVKESKVDKRKVPAYKRKESGDPDWKVSKADLEKEATKSKTTAAGLARHKKEIGL